MDAILRPIVDLLQVILQFYYDNVFQNYGIAIILLTITVRVVLLPLTITQTKSMIEMQKVQPKLKALQEKYKKDKERLQKEMLAFYQEHKINPLAGCFPLLLQMPVFFALFLVLQKYEPLKEASFLWISSLGKPDPYYILVVLMMATTFLTSYMITTDPKQSQIAYIMPIVLGIICINLQAGILLYWVVTNLWSIGQQYVMAKLYPKPTPEKGS